MIEFIVGFFLWSAVMWAAVLLFMFVQDVSVALWRGCWEVPRLVGRLCCRLVGGGLVSLLRARRARLSNRHLLADHA